MQASFTGQLASRFLFDALGTFFLEMPESCFGLGLGYPAGSPRSSVYRQQIISNPYLHNAQDKPPPMQMNAYVFLEKWF